MKMKNIIIALSLLFAVTTYAQNKNYADLPARATQFLAEQFPKQTILSVKDTNGNRAKGFTVTLSNNTEIKFKSDGNWKEIDGNGKEISTVFVIQPIQDYVAKNYPNQKISKIKYTVTNIDIELTNDIDLDFDSNGKFIKID